MPNLVQLNLNYAFVYDKSLMEFTTLLQITARVPILVKMENISSNNYTTSPKILEFLVMENQLIYCKFIVKR